MVHLKRYWSCSVAKLINPLPMIINIIRCGSGFVPRTISAQPLLVLAVKPIQCFLVEYSF